MPIPCRPSLSRLRRAVLCSLRPSTHIEVLLTLFDKPWFFFFRYQAVFCNSAANPNYLLIRGSPVSRSPGRVYYFPPSLSRLFGRVAPSPLAYGQFRLPPQIPGNFRDPFLSPISHQRFRRLESFPQGTHLGDFSLEYTGDSMDSMILSKKCTLNAFLAPCRSYFLVFPYWARVTSFFHASAQTSLDTRRFTSPVM